LKESDVTTKGGFGPSFLLTFLSSILEEKKHLLHGEGVPMALNFCWSSD
jgi:hypothetical protein